MVSERSFQATGVCAPGVLRIPHLHALVPETGRLVRVRGRVSGRLDSLAGWGTGRGAARARRIAERRRLTYLALEDGFIRALGPAAAGAPPSSLIVDPLGIYYDATRPSALEWMLENVDCPAAVLEEAQAALALLLDRRLARVDSAPEPAAGDLEPGKPLVLVIDQARGDPSVELGLAGERQFSDMLDAALDENPGAQVLVKLHPAVIAGRYQGYLAGRARQLGVGLIAQDVDALALLERASRVYTVTSRCGMEALLCGTRVICFGVPFYAGWGATDDRVRCPRRSRRRTALEIFALAYGHYARYVDPISGEACSLGRWLERLAVIKRADERNRGHTECLGFDRRQRRAARAFLCTSRGSLGHGSDPGRALAAAVARGGRLCSPAGHAPAGLEAAATAAGLPLIRVADGFLRAPGGAGGRLPASLLLDRRGIHYDPSRPSELEEILEYERFDDAVLDAARRLRGLLARGVAEDAACGSALPRAEDCDLRAQGRLADGPGGSVPPRRRADSRRRVLVPGEVEDDPAVRLGGGALGSNLALLQAVRAARPDACLVFQLPPAASGRRRGRRAAAELASKCDVVLPAASAVAALAAVDEVHTLTSLTGFEALLRGLPVVTYGAPFYAGWGLTEDRVSLPRRTRRLTLDELVAGALILYPAYVDPVTGLACDAETAAWRLSQTRHGTRQRFGGLGLRRLVQRLRALTLGASRQRVPRTAAGHQAQAG